MTFRVVRGALADAEIDDFGRYAAEYSEDFAKAQFARLNRIFAVDLAEAPNTWGYFSSPARRTAHIFSASGGEQVIGSSIPSMTAQRSSMCYASGTPAKSPDLSRL
jgi:hypothetical protein